MHTVNVYLDRIDDGYKHHLVPIPPEIVAKIKGKGACRIVTIIADPRNHLLPE